MTIELTPALRERAVNTIRFLAVDAVEKAKSGHPGAPMGLAPVAFELWDQHLCFDPSNPGWPLRDRFVLSAGHASMLLYGLLHLYGYDLPLQEVRRFRQLGSHTAGHPEYGETPGVEVTTGPLGQGFAAGVGMALAGRLTQARFSRIGAAGEGPGRHFIYGIVSDGDLMEGISAEAASLAGHLRLGNLIYLYDDNNISIDGSTDITFTENVAGRFEAQRWHVQSVDGLDHESLGRSLAAARAEEHRPSLIVVRTTIGYGSPNLAGTAKTHGAPLGSDETRATKEALGWPLEPDFFVPDDVRDYLSQQIEVKRAERIARDEAFATWERAHSELAAQHRAARERRVDASIVARLARDPGDKKATRVHSGAALNDIAGAVPFLVGGSADLAASNNSRINESSDVGSGDGIEAFAGRNIHFGVREHAMGAITNGLSLDGTFLPYAATFLVFSDYMRPAIRLAALMKLRTIYLFTHDSIFLGEDGPTHQPIEHLDCLRAIPGLHVFRPADGLETRMAWAWALARAQGPTAFCLTRQGVAALERPTDFQPEAVWSGAYTVVEPAQTPEVVMLASGSEVSLACDAAAKLGADGISARVVSAPCLELFEARSPEERSALLPKDGTPIVAVEAARGESFRRYIGPRGLIYGIDRFGASAPAADLAQHFGFTPERLAARVKQHLATN